MISRGILLLWIFCWALLLGALALGYGNSAVLEGVPPPSAERLASLSFNTFYMGILAAIGALIWAIPVSVTLHNASGWMRKFLFVLAIYPLFVSPPVIAVAAIRLFGPSGFISHFFLGDKATFPVAERIRSDAPQIASAPIYTLTGGAFTLAWYALPIALLVLVNALRSRPVDQEQAALLDTKPFRVFFSITLPSLKPALFTAFGLLFFFCLIEFGIPESLRSLPVLVSEIYVQAGVFYNLRAATLVGFLTILLSALVLSPIAKFLSTRDQFETEDHHSKIPVSRFFSGVGIFMTALPGVALFLVLLITATGPHGPIELWKTVWGTASNEIFKSIILGIFSAFICMAIGGLLGTALFRSSKSFWLKVLLLVPFLTPSPLLGIAMNQLLRLSFLPEPIANAMYLFGQTHGPLMIIWALRFAPIVALFVDASLRRNLSDDAQENLRLLPLGFGRFLTDFSVPLAGKAMMMGGLVVFALSLSEVGAAVLLMPPGVTNLGVRMMTLMHQAPSGQVSALCLLMTLPGIVSTLLIFSFRKRGTESVKAALLE